MSELIAEARVLVTPDTTGFRQLLVTEVAAASKGVVVPVAVTPVVTGVTGAAGTAALATAQDDLAVATGAASTAASAQARAIATVNTQEAINTRQAVEGATAATSSARARNEDAAAAARQARALSGLGRGAGSAGASLLGVRGATLAATGPFIAGAAAAIGFTKAIQTFTSFNQELSVFAATTGASADEIDRVSESAKQLGKDITLPAASAGDAAEAMTEFAKAGLSVSDSIRAARGGLQLATAAQLSNADAVEITANALNAFKLSGDQAVQVADTLANAANAAQGSIADVGLGLKQSAGAAAVVGVSFRDTTALLTLLAKNGLTASDAGTSLRTAFIRLVNPSKQAQAILKDLNVNLRDAQGNLRPEVFAEFAAAQRNLSRATQDSNAAIVFGQDAFRAFGILSREGASGLDDTRTKLDQTGTAAKIAGARMVGLAGDVENLKNQMSALGIEIGKVGAGLAGPIVRGLTHFGESVEEVGGKIKDFFTTDQLDVTAQGFDTLAANALKLQTALKFEGGGAFSPAIADAFNQTVDEMEKKGEELIRQGFLKRFVDQFTAVSPDVKKAFQDNIITPAEEAQLQGTALGRAFLEALPHTAQFFQDFGISAESGIEAARAALADPQGKMAKALRLGLEDAGANAKADAARVGTEIGDTVTDSIAASASRIQDLIAKALSTRKSSARLAAGSAATNLIDIQFQGGSVQQQIAGLKQQLKAQDDLVDALVGDPNAKQSKINEAKLAAISTQNQIDSLQGQLDSAAAATIAKAKTDAERRRREAQDAARTIKAANDAAFLQSQDDARARQQRLISLAGDTPALADDIRRQQQLRVMLQKQIAAIKASALDEKDKAAALRDLRSASLATTDELKRLHASQKQQQAEQRAQTQEQLAENLALRTQIAEARDAGTNAVVRRIDAEIANQKKVVAQAKQAGKGVLEATLALEELKKKKRDLLKAAKDQQDEDKSGSGLTVFDILRENVETFNRTGGNLVTGNQPFAGPTGFTADVAQFLHRGGQAPTVTVSKDSTAPLISVNAELVRVIQDNTDAIRSSDTGDGKGKTSPKTAVRWSVGSFYTARVARQLTEADSG